METSDSNRSGNPSFASTFKELISGVQKLIRGEIRLATAEVKGSIKEAGRNTAFAAFFGMLVILGLVPWVAFLVIGLGKLLNDNYWLSSLVVAIVHIALGALLAARFGRKVMHENLGLPQTRESIQKEAEIVKGRLQEVASAPTLFRTSAGASTDTSPASSPSESEVEARDEESLQRRAS